MSLLHQTPSRFYVTDWQSEAATVCEKKNVNTCNLKVVCSLSDSTGVTLTLIAFEINLAVAAEQSTVISRVSPGHSHMQ